MAAFTFTPPPPFTHPPLRASKPDVIAPLTPHCRYGQRALVNENVGSLVNTLTLHKTSDMRLEAFARLLSEEWDVGVFIDFLNAQAMALQVGASAFSEHGGATADVSSWGVERTLAVS